jgi:hypothetical protein
LLFFRDLLSDKPVQGADAIHGLPGWSERSVGGVGKGEKQVNTTVWDEEAENLYFSSLGLKNRFINTLFTNRYLKRVFNCPGIIYRALGETEHGRIPYFADNYLRPSMVTSSIEVPVWS